MSEENKTDESNQADDSAAGQEEKDKEQGDQKANDKEQDGAKGDEQKSEDQKDEELEDYGDLKFSEGAKPDEGLLNEFKDLGKELKLTAEQAQKLVDFQAKVGGLSAQQLSETLESREAEWQTELAKEFGEDGLRAAGVKVQNLFKSFDPEGKVSGFLDEQGLGNCAPLFKMFAKISEDYGEDSLTKGGGKNSKGDIPDYNKMGYKSLDEY